MSFLASDVIQDFRYTFPDCSSADALGILKEADEELSSFLSIRLSDLYFAVTNGSPFVTIADTISRVEHVEIVYPNLDRAVLEAQSESGMEFFVGGWRSVTGVPSAFMSTQDSAAGPQIGLYPVPNFTTISVTGATNATPIVITTNSAHGLSDGSQVGIQNVTGNTAANGFFYAKVTGYSATTFALYSDLGLTSAVAGSGAYVSGGIISTMTKPFLCARVASKEANMTTGTVFRYAPAIRRLYASCMRFIWATKRHTDLVATMKAQYDEALNTQTVMTYKKAVDTPVSIQVFRQDMSYRR